MTHPLTDMDTSQPITIEDAMRIAADWQLEQVMKWLKSQKDYPGSDYYDLSTLESIECSLRQAMRPQEDNS